MSSNSPLLGLAYIASGQAQKEVTHNDALNDLDTFAQIAVVNRTTNAPPASPSDGDAYIIGPSPTGAWVGLAGKLALYYAGWKIKVPHEGWLAWLKDEDQLCIFDGTNWTGFRVTVAAGTVGAPSVTFNGDSDTGMYTPGANQLSLVTGGAARLSIDASGNALPGADNTLNLGSASLRWKTVYAGTGTINTSDARAKEEVAEVDGAFATAMVRRLAARSYRWKKRARQGRVHYGFVAQEVGDALVALGRSGEDFGGYVYDGEADLYGLRYEQFVPLLWSSLQQVLERLDVLEGKA